MSKPIKLEDGTEILHRPRSLEEQAIDELAKVIKQICEIRKLQDDLRELIRKGGKIYGNEKVRQEGDRH